MVLTLVPKTLNELLPLFCRSCRKPMRKDCSAEVELDDSVLEDRLDEESVLLIIWLSLGSWTSTLSAEIMSCGPYADAAPVLADGADAVLAATTGVAAASAANRVGTKAATAR